MQVREIMKKSRFLLHISKKEKNEMISCEIYQHGEEFCENIRQKERLEDIDFVITTVAL
jgi:hypothetical protein